MIRRLHLLLAVAVLPLLGGCNSKTKPAEPTGPEADKTRATFEDVRSLLNDYHDRTGDWPVALDSYALMEELAAKGVLMPDRRKALTNPAGEVVDGWGMQIGYYTGGPAAKTNLREHYKQLSEKVPVLVSAGPDERWGTDDDMFDPK